MTEERFNELIKKAREEMQQKNDEILQRMVDEINEEEARDAECECGEECCGECCCEQGPEDAYVVLNEEAANVEDLECRGIYFFYDDGFPHKEIDNAVRVEFDTDANRDELIVAAITGYVTLVKYFFEKEKIDLDINKIVGEVVEIIGKNVKLDLLKKLF